MSFEYRDKQWNKKTLFRFIQFALLPVGGAALQRHYNIYSDPNIRPLKFIHFIKNIKIVD